MKEITVDYELLKKQISALAGAQPRRKGDVELFDGLFELLHAIEYQRPFKEALNQ